jgi:hypothetical protein
MSSQNSAKLALIAFSLLLGACSFQFQAGASAGTRNTQRTAAQPAPRKSGYQPPAAPATTTKTPTTTTPTSTAEAPRITGKNAFGNGSIGAFTGKAYVIPNTTTKLPDLSKMVPFATLLTDSFIVQTHEFTEGFPGVLKQDEWFALRYDGVFEITKDATYSFKLTSDDGAILYIDGEKVVDNDGIHATSVKTGTKALKPGKHSLRLDYFQGAHGPVALALSVAEGANPEQHRPLVGIR